MSSRCVLLLAACVLGAAASALAQAHPMPAGVGAFSIGFQAISNTGHRLSDGYLLELGSSLNRSTAFSLDYGVSSRLSLSAGMPFVRARYTDEVPPPVPLPVDTGHEWQQGLQDFAFGARYNAIARGPLAVSVSAAFLLPSHDYNYQGEAVIGRRLNELQLGVHVARTLDELTPRLELQAGYAYAFVEKAEVDVQNDRSNFYAGASYLATRRLQLHAAALWQRTHGGLRFGDGPEGSLAFPGDVNTPARLAEHDRLLRDNSFHLEGGASVSLGIVDLFATYLAYVSGTDTHAGHAITVGATLYFGRLPGRGAAPASSGL